MRCVVVNLNWAYAFIAIYFKRHSTQEYPLCPPMVRKITAASAPLCYILYTSPFFYPPISTTTPILRPSPTTLHEMASNTRPARRILSDRLRGMRFMKQKEEKELRDKLCAEQKAREQAVHWTLKSEDEVTQERGPIVIIEDGVGDDPMQGRLGRRSFGKFRKSGREEGEGKKGEKEKEREGVDVEGVRVGAEMEGRRRKEMKGGLGGLLKGAVVKKESRAVQLRKSLKSFKEKGIKSGKP